MRTIRTFGHDFRDAGYATGIAGKWQLGKFDEFPHQPVEHGFEEYCMWYGFTGAKNPADSTPRRSTARAKSSRARKTITDEDFFNDFLLDFIDRKKDKPFFFYFPMALVHSPFVHPPELEDLASTNYPDGLDKKTAAFGHMITYMDEIIGNILCKLREHQLDQNTLVLFTGDNGIHRSITSYLPGLEITGGKGTMTEAGSRVPFLAWWHGRSNLGSGTNSFASSTSSPRLLPWPGLH